MLAFQDWRVYLEGSPHQVRVISDHKNLEQFLFTKHLNRRQARWSEILLAFDLAIHHRPGSLNGRADVLSRRVDVTDGIDEEPRPFLHLAYLERLEPVWTDVRIFTQIKASLREDSKLRPILAFFESNPEAAPADIRRRFQAYTWEDGLLRFEEAVFVPDHEELRRQILRSRHDAPAAGHQGRAKTPRASVSGFLLANTMPLCSPLCRWL